MSRVGSAGDIAVSADASAASDVERATGALLYMLVRIATGGACRHTVEAVDHHLALLAMHPQAGEHLRRVAAVLGGEWREALNEAERRASGDTAASQRRH